MFKDVPVHADEKALLLLLSWWLSWQLRLVLILLYDTTVTVIVTLVHGLFLLVMGTKECIPSKVVLVVQDVTILQVGYPEVGIKLREEVWLIIESLDTYSVLDTSRSVSTVDNKEMVGMGKIARLILARYL